MARAPMLPFGKAPPFTDGDPFSMSRTLRWMVENLRTPQEGTIKASLGSGKYRVETFVAPESYIYCKGCGLTVGQKVILWRPIGGTDLDADTEWIALPSCPDGGDGDGDGSGSGVSGDSGSGSGECGSGEDVSGSGEPSGSGVSGSGVSGSGGPPSGDGGSGGSGTSGSGGDGDGGDGGSGGCGGSGSGSGGDGGVIRPDDGDLGACCPPDGGGSGSTSFTASPDFTPLGACAPTDLEANETTLSFTRDTLCAGEVVPVGQGYWRGPTPYAEVLPPLDEDFVVFCDLSAPGSFERDPLRFRGFTVFRDSGCINAEYNLASAQCDPFELRFTRINPNCIDGQGANAHSIVITG